MKWLNYHHLYYFKVIATEGGIAKAAEKLKLGQPTLSTQLKQFEEALGRPLFERRNRRMVLTEAGRTTLIYASEIFRMGDEMIEALNDRLVSNRVHVSIGALDSIPKSFIASLTDACYRAGDCRVSILEGKGDELFRELFNHSLDLILSNFPPAIGDKNQVYARSLVKLPVLVCGAPEFRTLAKNFPESLDRQPFVLPTAHSRLRHDLDHFFQTRALHIDPVSETQDASLQKLLSIRGRGLIPIVRPAVQDLLDNRSLVEIGTLDGISEEFWLISTSRKIENPIASKVLKSFTLNFG